jgi:hypothetical protein
MSRFNHFIEHLAVVKDLRLCYNSATMKQLNLEGLIPTVAGKIAPMLDDLLAAHASNIHSIHITGSAVVPDYSETMSDINSVVVLRDMDLKFIAFLAPLGKKYGKKKIAAPLVMTPEYITGSLDAFPIEFLDFKLIHKTVYGQDIFDGLVLDKSHLRLQVERELKTKLIGLRQCYISSLGKKENLAGILVRSFTGSMALFRAIISLLGNTPPIARTEVISLLRSASAIDTEIFEDLLALKTGRIKPTEQRLQTLFERYYRALEAAGKIIDELPT